MEIKKNVSIKCVYDIGAYKGEWANFYKKTALSKCKFILFEANSAHVASLKKNNFQFFITTLSDKVKEVEFYSGNFSGDSYYKENTYNYDKLLPSKRITETLDNIVNNNNLPLPDLIKIDTQGSEIDIINGGIDIFKKAKGILMEISLVEYNINSPAKEFVYEYMDNLGFKPVELIGNINHPITYELIQQDIFFLNKNYDNTLAIQQIR